MKAKILTLVLLITLVPNIVFAKEEFFSNSNGVSLTEKEYNYIVKRFDIKFPDIMTLDDYDNLINDEFLNSKIQIVESTPIMPLAVEEYRTQSKSLKISSACNSSTCNMVVVLTWLKSANVRSYDVIGAYLNGVSLKNTPITTLYSNDEAITSMEIVQGSNGFGVSVKLPNSDGIQVYQYYNVTPGGIINASYQHATSKISLANSKKYTFASSGYGGVFLFDSSINNIYDGMGGVIIKI